MLCPGPRATATWWLLTASALWGTTAAWGEHKACTLASLSLRFGDRPIDLTPLFRPDIFEYSATLDFSMRTFSVAARPDTGCQVEGVPAAPVPVRIGGSEEIRLSARRVLTGDSQVYTVTVVRLLGSETDLHFLAVEGGELSPAFDPTIRSYNVRLSLGLDEVRVVYRLRDNEQRIRCSAQEQHPTGQDSSAGRRLEAAEGLPHQRAGEVQFRYAEVSFMLDVGFSRSIELTIQCADATQASIGTYTLQVTRPECTPETPFFNPLRRLCVNFCPAGFYQNREAQRCSSCNTNCQVCAGLLDCRMCKPNTADFIYVIQPNGSCRAIKNHIFNKYLWWCIGLGVLLLVLVLVGTCMTCFVCCGGLRQRADHHARAYDSDSDEPLEPLKGRRLATY